MFRAISKSPYKKSPFDTFPKESFDVTYYFNVREESVPRYVLDNELYMFKNWLGKNLYTDTKVNMYSSANEAIK